MKLSTNLAILKQRHKQKRNSFRHTQDKAQATQLDTHTHKTKLTHQHQLLLDACVAHLFSFLSATLRFQLLGFLQQIAKQKHTNVISDASIRSETTQDLSTAVLLSRL